MEQNLQIWNMWNNFQGIMYLLISEHTQECSQTHIACDGHGPGVESTWPLAHLLARGQATEQPQVRADVLADLGQLRTCNTTQT